MQQPEEKAALISGGFGSGQESEIIISAGLEQGRSKESFSPSGGAGASLLKAGNPKSCSSIWEGD